MYHLWSLTLTEERRLCVFENRLLRRIFGLKMDEVTGEWRRVLCSVLLTRYHSGDQVKKTEMGRTCSTYGQRTDAYWVLVGKPEVRKLLG